MDFHPRPIGDLRDSALVFCGITIALSSQTTASEAPPLGGLLQYTVVRQLCALRLLQGQSLSTLSGHSREYHASQRVGFVRRLKRWPARLKKMGQSR